MVCLEGFMDASYDIKRAMTLSEFLYLDSARQCRWIISVFVYSRTYRSVALSLLYLLVSNSVKVRGMSNVVVNTIFLSKYRPSLQARYYRLFQRLDRKCLRQTKTSISDLHLFNFILWPLTPKFEQIAASAVSTQNVYVVHESPWCLHGP